MLKWNKEIANTKRMDFEKLINETVGASSKEQYMQAYDNYMNNHVIGDVGITEWDAFYSLSRLESFFKDNLNNIYFAMIGKLITLFESEYSTDKYIKYNKNRLNARTCKNSAYEQNYLTEQQWCVIKNQEYIPNICARKSTNLSLLLPIICELSYSCFFKQSEILELEVDDIKTESFEIKNKKRDKVNEARSWIEINPKFNDLLIEYIDYRSSQQNSSRYLIDKSLYENFKGNKPGNTYINKCLSILKSPQNKELLDINNINCDMIIKSSILHKLDNSNGSEMVNIIHVFGFNSSNTYIKDATTKYLNKINANPTF